MSRVVVATVPDREAAAIIVQILDEADIDARLEPRAGDAYFGSTQSVSFVVAVDPEDEVAARAALASDEDQDVDAAAARAAASTARPDAAEPAVVLSSWDRRRQTFALLLLLIVPLPLASYYARAKALGHVLLLVFLAAALGLRLTDHVELWYVVVAAKALDAWLAPVLLAQRQRQRRHRPALRWALLLPLFWGLGFVLHRNADYEVKSKRALLMAVELIPQVVLGTLTKIPPLPDVPVGRVAQRFMEQRLSLTTIVRKLEAPALDVDTALATMWQGIPVEADYARVASILDRRLAKTAELSRAVASFFPSLRQLAGKDPIANQFLLGLGSDIDSAFATLPSQCRKLELLRQQNAAYRAAPDLVTRNARGENEIRGGEAGTKLMATLAPIEKELRAIDAEEAGLRD